jgi:carbonic anhydrase
MGNQGKLLGVLVLASMLLGGASGWCDETFQCNEARPPTADGAVQSLIDGNKRWASGKVRHPGQDFGRRECVYKEGQTPFAAIVSCSDSRVPTELIFDEGVGDLFIVRVAGNSVDTVGRQSLAYSTGHLGVETILVLGHQKCGAVKAAVDTYPKPSDKFLMLIYSAVEKAKELIHQRGGNSDDKEALVSATTDQHVISEVSQLRSASPFKESIAAGKLKIVGGRYDLDTGLVTMLIQ